MQFYPMCRQGINRVHYSACVNIFSHIWNLPLVSYTGILRSLHAYQVFYLSPPSLALSCRLAITYVFALFLQFHAFHSVKLVTQHKPAVIPSTSSVLGLWHSYPFTPLTHMLMSWTVSWPLICNLPGMFNKDWNIDHQWKKRVLWYQLNIPNATVIIRAKVKNSAKHRYEDTHHWMSSVVHGSVYYIS